MGGYAREDLQPAGLSLTWWRKSQDRARLEGCHRMSAATHMICGLEGLE